MSSNLLAGYGERSITPAPGSELSGFGYYLHRRGLAIRDELKARAICLATSHGSLLLISCDLLGLTAGYSDTLRRRIAGDLGLPVARVLLACTHTHTAPAIQSLAGLGVVDPAYPETLATAILAAAKDAAADLQPATLSFAARWLEPIGYNRQQLSFLPIDPMLAVLTIRRAGERIFLFNYACHPVTLGAAPVMSADWPGAAIAALEAAGDRGLFLQGFCGNINPVSWRHGHPDDTGEESVVLYGDLVSRRLRSMVLHAEDITEFTTAAATRDISLPRILPDLPQLDERVQEWHRRFPHNPGAHRFIAQWAEEARGYLAAGGAMELAITITALRIGPLSLLAFPGELFCEYGLRLRERWPRLLPVGYANGNVGYFPTEASYENTRDYAAYEAPLFYHLFPFAPEVEHRVTAGCVAVLEAAEIPPAGGAENVE